MRGGSRLRRADAQHPAADGGADAAHPQPALPAPLPHVGGANALRRDASQLERRHAASNLGGRNPVRGERPAVAVSRRIRGAGLPAFGCRYELRLLDRQGRVLLSLLTLGVPVVCSLRHRAVRPAQRDRKCGEAAAQCRQAARASACFPVCRIHPWYPCVSLLGRPGSPCPARPHGDLRLPCAAGSRAGHARQGNLWRGTLVDSLGPPSGGRQPAQRFLNGCRPWP